MASYFVGILVSFVAGFGVYDGINRLTSNEDAAYSFGIAAFVFTFVVVMLLYQIEENLRKLKK